SRGLIRWLRPEFQNPAGTAQKQFAPEEETGDEEEAAPVAKPAKPVKQPWPKTIPERVRALRAALANHAGPTTAGELSKLFTRAPKDAVEELLETLVEVGQARVTDDGRFVA